MNIPSSGPIQIQVPSRRQLSDALNHAVEFLKPAAMTRRVGIRVTRRSIGLYTAGLCESVPYGTTYEEWK